LARRAYWHGQGRGEYRVGGGEDAPVVAGPVQRAGQRRAHQVRRREQRGQQTAGAGPAAGVSGERDGKRDQTDRRAAIRTPHQRRHRQVTHQRWHRRAMVAGPLPTQVAQPRRRRAPAGIACAGITGQRRSLSGSVASPVEQVIGLSLAAHLVTCQDGDVEFEFIAGDAALDFVATISEWTTTHRERLTCPRDLADWLVKAGIVDTPPRVDTGDLQAARELRAELYELVVRLTSAQPIPARSRMVINRYAAVVPPTVTLGVDGRGRTTGTTLAALSQLARCGINLGRPGRLALITWCADDTCTRAFLDRSRGGRRRWCGMSGCGDRAKAAAYRRRQHEGA
jgi:predicted RNA-binding Zn ribbon-like protein